MTRILLILVLALAVGLVPVSASAQPGEGAGNATIDEIVVSVRGGRIFTPIAVPDTYMLGGTDPSGLQQMIATTIRDCLQIAGYFEIYGPDRYFFDPSNEGMTPSTINFANWHNVNAQGLIKTSFRVATNQAALDFRLYNVDAGEQIDIGWAPATVPLNAVQDEVFRFINKVIEYYTGMPGIFGSRIAFVARDRNGFKQIQTMTVGSREIGTVTSARTIHLLPAWGPGGEVLYTSYERGNPDLYLGRTPLSSRPGLNSGAAMRPGGGEVAVTLTIDGQAEIYVLNASSGDIVRRCTDNRAEDVSPSWSPDGSQIAFVSDRSGGPQIFVMNADCSNQRRITFAGNYNTTPDWSPTGNLIAFTGRDSRNRFDIFTVDVSTGYINRLTQDQGNNEEPSWSPDGQYIAFQSTRGGAGSRLYIMTSDGDHQTLITPDGSGYQQPAWSR